MIFWKLVGYCYGERMVQVISLLVSLGMVQFIGADQALANQRTLRTFVIGSILPLFDSAVGLIMALATVAFLVGVVRFIGTAGDDKSRSDGKQLMVWGTLALFCMVGVWGLVQIIKTTFFGKLP